MIANEERLALILEANDKATSVLQRVRKEILDTQKSTRGLNQETEAYDASGSKVRRGALAFGAVAQAANEAKLGTMGAVRAASSLAETLALVSRSAKFASWATGIGAAVAILGTFYTLLQDTNAEIDKASPAMERLLGDVDIKQTEAIIAGLHRRMEQLTAGIEKGDASLGEKIKRRLLTADPFTADGREEIRTGNDKEQAQRVRDLLQAEQDYKAAQEKLADLRRSGRQSERSKAQQDADRLKDQADKDGKTHVELYRKLGNDRVLAFLETSGQLRAAEETQIDSELINQELAIQKLVISDEKKHELLEAALLASEERKLAIENRFQQDAARQRLDFADRVRALEDVKEQASLKRKQQIVGGLIHGAIAAQGPLMKQLKRLALEPVAAELEGLAIREGVKVVTSWPNAAAMAKHAAGAALAIAGAREVYALAGGGGSGKGGGGSSGGGDASGAGTFQPRDDGQRGTAVINLYTTNPYGREQIQQVKFELDRAGVMKRPGVEIAPTTGFTSQ